MGGLVQAGNGDLYGTTWWRGAFNPATGDSAGTVFQITPARPYRLTTIYTFCHQSGCADGGDPDAALIQGTDGNLYGTRSSGGIGTILEGNVGTVFSISPVAPYTFSLLYTFCSGGSPLDPCTDGANPVDELVQATNGTFYGTTDTGVSASNAGTVFSLSVGLGRSCKHRLPPAKWEPPSRSWATI
jgi:hypothetical protein